VYLRESQRDTEKETETETETEMELSAAGYMYQVMRLQSDHEAR
jgi:hypothetical protein